MPKGEAHSHQQDRLNHSFHLISDRSSISSKANSSNESENRVFSCNYCTQKFSSAQALGGHQNAHRRERMMVKQRQLHLDAAALRPHSSAAWIPLHGGSSLGMQVQKPNVGVQMYQRRFPLQQQAVGWQPAENSGGGAARFDGGGAARFDGGWRFTTAVDGSGGSQLKSGSRHEFNHLDLSLKL